MNYTGLSIEDKGDWMRMASSLWHEETNESLEKVFNDLIGLSNYNGIICRSDSGEAAGFIYLTIRSDYVEGSSSSPVAYIEGIYVEPQHRKKGVARKLTLIAEEWAVSRGCQEIGSDAYLDNSESRLFHRAIGFAESEPVVHFIKPIKNAAQK
jgi:aminoglycoside 6'-N-acetyltransferase I